MTNSSENINNQLIENEYLDPIVGVVKRTAEVIAIGIGAPIVIVGGPFIGIGVNMVNMSVCWITTPFIGSIEYIATGNLDLTKSYLHESIHLNEKLIDTYWNLRDGIQNALNGA